MTSNTDAYAAASQWLIGTAKRNPEALLVLAAGCALLMRSGGSTPQVPSAPVNDGLRYGETEQFGRPRQVVSQAAENASEYASNIKDRVSGAAATVSDAASSYVSSAVSSASEYAGTVGRTISAQASRLSDQTQSTVQTGFGYLLREQPLAVVAFGIAAGAAIAAVLPSTEAEDRNLGPAREAIAGAAGKVGENLMEAAGEAGERLKQSAAERGLSSEALKGLAHEVANTFSNTITGKSDSDRGSGAEIIVAPADSAGSRP